jgi:hypothetical protein
VCLVVGTLASGFASNSGSDVIVTDQDMSVLGESPLQIFWEAFPAGSGPTDRTTYMFSYMDAGNGLALLFHTAYLTSWRQTREGPHWWTSWNYTGT